MKSFSLLRKKKLEKGVRVRGKRRGGPCGNDGAREGGMAGGPGDRYAGEPGKEKRSRKKCQEERTLKKKKGGGPLAGVFMAGTKKS